MLTRRTILITTAALIAMPAAAADETFASLEKTSGGRLGLAALDTGSGQTLSWRTGERFAMCSTFKLLLAAAVLQRIDTGRLKPDQRVVYGAADLVTWSPVTEKYVGVGMEIGALLDAILVYSDNTAANLLLNAIGGPAAWTAFARSLGDDVSRLDRTEIALNTAIPGDDRDTTTPSAMLADLNKVLLGDVLSPASRKRLIDTMAQSTTGTHRLKAGLPEGWRIAEKTGSGGNGTRNDIGIIFPPGRAPILACAYFTGSTRPDADKEAVLAEVGRAIAKI